MEQDRTRTPLDRWFDLAAQGTSVRTEILAGTTTFLALAYIVFVQPAVLAAAGMDFGAVMTATCLASALATLLMGLWANYPIAVAPAMGHNFFFAFTVVVGMGVPWQAALGAVAVAVAGLLLTAGIGLRERVITALPPFLQHAIAAGIGLLIAMIGLQWAGLVVASPGTLVTLGDLTSPPVLAAAPPAPTGASPSPRSGRSRSSTRTTTRTTRRAPTSSPATTASAPAREAGV